MSDTNQNDLSLDLFNRKKMDDLNVVKTVSNCEILFIFILLLLFKENFKAPNFFKFSIFLHSMEFG